MTSVLLSKVRDRIPLGNVLRGIDPGKLKEFMQQSHAPEWHAFAITHRMWRPHASVPCRWLSEVLPHDAPVFEPGCGSGANLLWLGQQGFRHLLSADISAEALALGDLLARELGIPMETWQDNGITPSRLPENLGGIVSVNWFYHIPGASLTAFLTTYRKALRPGGYLALDMVTRHYDRVPGNQWHSDDQKLPEGQRRPSEYTVRLDRAEMECLACRCGFALVRSTCFVLSRPQRAAYLLRRVD